PPRPAPAARRSAMPHALVMMLLIIVATAALTYVVPSGAYQREKSGLVVPGSFHRIPKQIADAVITSRPTSDSVAHPASLVSLVTSIPAGMVRAAPLVMMILFIGGMFGVLQQTGALEAGIERLLGVTGGNVYIVAPVLMILLAAGSTFLGLISEYLVV